MALSNNVPTTFYATEGLAPLVPDLDQPLLEYDANEPYLDQLHYFMSLPDDELPTVLTNSYGEDEQSLPEPYTNATCSLFAQLGARGVSVIYSSGDTGVGSACQTNWKKQDSPSANVPGMLPIRYICRWDSRR